MRVTLGYSSAFYGLAFGSWERSNLRQINNRWVVAAGLGYKLVQRERAYISVTNLLLHETTDFLERTDLSLWRNSTRILGEFAPVDKLKIYAACMYQPSISEKNNVRWSATLSIQYRVGKGVSFRTKFDNINESYVVAGRKNNDFRWTVGFAFEY